MKVISFTRPDGGVSIVTPSPGARLALYITLADASVIVSPRGAQPVDSFLRGWPVAGAVAEWAETEDEFLARIAQKDVPADATNVATVDSSVIPGDRTFRNAWKQGVDGSVAHDLPTARQLMRDMLRAERSQRFPGLDGQWMRAAARNDAATAAVVEAKREALRNWPTDPRIPGCSTCDDLKSLLSTMKQEV